MYLYLQTRNNENMRRVDLVECLFECRQVSLDSQILSEFVTELWNNPSYDKVSNRKLPLWNDDVGFVESPPLDQRACFNPN